jgi:2-polyprenyl-3-methyl-5-hydroxy-6-metoxy-1,4-benzoquinol methylase
MFYRPLLEPLLQDLRIRKIFPHIPPQGVLVDVGCDEPQELIRRVSRSMKQCIGLDIVATPYKKKNITILKQDLQKTIKLPSTSADVMTMLAVLEHMKHPNEIVAECYRILKPGGVLLVTVPSPANKPLLELLSAVGLVRKEMIHQHENYFTVQRLTRLMKRTGFSFVHVELFELGLNTFCKAVK